MLDYLSPPLLYFFTVYLVWHFTVSFPMLIHWWLGMFNSMVIFLTTVYWHIGTSLVPILMGYSICGVAVAHILCRCGYAKLIPAHWQQTIIYVQGVVSAEKIIGRCQLGRIGWARQGCCLCPPVEAHCHGFLLLFVQCSISSLCSAEQFGIFHIKYFLLNIVQEQKPCLQTRDTITLITDSLIIFHQK